MTSSTNQQTSSTHGSYPSCRRDPVACLTVIAATATFIVTAWFANATFSGGSSARTIRLLTNVLHISTANTLTVLSILQGVLSFLMGIVLDDALEMAQWSLMGRAQGLQALSILGLSPTTGAAGTLGILFSRMANKTNRIWAGSKMFFRLAIWLSAILLFVDTSLDIVYEPTFTYQLVAGVGQFNGSYVRSYIQQFNTLNPGYELEVVPFSDLAIAQSLVTNPVHSVASPPVNCTEDDCDSYLLPGGLALTYPWPPTNHTQSPVIVIHSAIGTQVDFKEGLVPGDAFQNDDCDVFGDTTTRIGVRFCVARSQVQAGAFTAGLYVCNGTRDGTCLENGSASNLTTTFSIYSRRSTVVASRSNFSILSVAYDGPVTHITDTDLDAYRMAMGWLLNYTAAGIPAPSSLAEYFWAAPTQLTSIYWSSELRQAMYSILAYPLWAFNTNNYGNIDLVSLTNTSSLPSEYHTSASVASPYTKIVVNKVMFVVFVIMETSVLLFAWAVLLWLFFSDQRLQETSSYPLMDFAFKTRNVELDTPIASQQPFSKDPAEAGSRDVRESAGKMRISIRSAVGKARPLARLWPGKLGKRNTRPRSATKLNTPPASSPAPNSCSSPPPRTSPTPPSSSQPYPQSAAPPSANPSLSRSPALPSSSSPPTASPASSAFSARASPNPLPSPSPEAMQAGRGRAHVPAGAGAGLHVMPTSR